MSRRRSGPRNRRRRALLVAASLAVMSFATWQGYRLIKKSDRDDSERIRVAARAQDWRTVETLLTRRLNRNPGDGASRVTLAGLYVAQDRRDEAKSQLEGVTSGDSAYSAARVMLGEIAFRSKRAAEAESAFRAAAERDPNSLEPRRRLLYLLSLTQRTKESRDVLWEIHRISPDPKTLIDLVTTLWDAETDARVFGPDLDAFLSETPDDPWLRRAKGLSHLLRGENEQALPHLSATANAIENDPIGRFALAECLRSLGRPLPTDVLDANRADSSERARILLLQGRLLEADGRLDQAAERYEQAAEAAPEYREARYRLGQGLLALGKPREGRAQLERSEAIRARQENVVKEHRRARIEGSIDPETAERLGRLCLDAGLIAEAKAWFRSGLSADRGRTSLQTALDEANRLPESLPFPIASPRRSRRSGLSEPVASTHVEPRSAVSPRFVDVSAKAGLVFQYDSGADGKLFIADTMGGGVGLIDVDSDGFLDVYFVNGCRLPVDAANPPRPNKLFRNRRDGTFEDITEKSGAGGRGYGMGCEAGDYDGDGDDDLFVTGFGGTILYRNDGKGAFEDVTKHAGVFVPGWSTAAGFGDLDGDGDLDLYVVTYVSADPNDSPQCRDNAGGPIHCSPGYFEAELDRLFRNNGDGTFTDVSAAAGIEVPKGRGLGLAIVDIDEDGKLDVFVANDASPNFLFRNLGGLKFEEVARDVGLACEGSGRATASMGVIADDLDGDLLIDIFHTNFLNEPNTFHKNLGRGFFSDLTLAAGLDASSRSRTGFGTAALDVDNDGALDVFVSNGHVDDQPWVQAPMAQTAQLYLGQGSGRFREFNAPESTYFSMPLVGRGVASGDLDNDGRVDLVVVHRDAPASLLRNETPGGHWLTVSLSSGESGGPPAGARITCVSGGKTQVKTIVSGTSYLSRNDPRAHFGLGSVRIVDRLEVRLPSGATRAWTNLEADRIIRIGKPNPTILGDE